MLDGRLKLLLRKFEPAPLPVSLVSPDARLMPQKLKAFTRFRRTAPQGALDFQSLVGSSRHRLSQHDRKPRPMLDVPNHREILRRRQDPAKRHRRRRDHHLQQSREAQRHVARHVGRARPCPGRIARRSRRAGGDPGRRRRQGVRLGRRYQPVRKDPPQRGGLGGIFQAQRSAARAAGGLSEADHRLHPRLLPRRRHAGGDDVRYPDRRRRQPVRHSRRQTRHRLWL